MKHQMLNHNSYRRHIAINFQRIIVINLDLVKLVLLMDLVNGIKKNALILQDAQHLLEKLILCANIYQKDV